MIIYTTQTILHILTMILHNSLQTSLPQCKLKGRVSAEGKENRQDICQKYISTGTWDGVMFPEAEAVEIPLISYCS
jgi:hypothetical protein